MIGVNTLLMHLDFPKLLLTKLWCVLPSSLKRFSLMGFLLILFSLLMVRDKDILFFRIYFMCSDLVHINTNKINHNICWRELLCVIELLELAAHFLVNTIFLFAELLFQRIRKFNKYYTFMGQQWDNNWMGKRPNCYLDATLI